MTAEITTVIGQLNRQGGAWRGDAPNQVAVREPKSADKPGAGKGDLFVLTEVRGNVTHRVRLEQQLAEIVRDAYYLARGSVTASLRRALQAANDLLLNRNYEVSEEELVIGGVVALVMHDEDAFVAQSGPAALFAVLGDFVRRYPAKSAWLSQAADARLDVAEPALGLRTVIEPNLHHLRISPGDVLVLTDSRLARHLPPGEVAKAVEGRDAKTAVKNLSKMTQAEAGSALVMTVIEQKQAAFGPLKVTPPASLGRFFPGQGQQAHKDESSTAAAPEPIAEPEPVLAGDNATRQVEPAPRGQPAFEKSASWYNAFAKKRGSDRSAPANGGHHTPVAEAQPARAATVRSQTTAKKEPVEPDDEAYDFEQRLGQEARELASMASEPTLQKDFHQRRSGSRPSPLGKAFRWVGAGLLMFVVLLGNGLRSILTMVLPGANTQAPRQAGLQARHTPPSPATWTILRNIAIAIPLLVGIIVGVSYLQKDRLREVEYSEFVDTAQSKFQQAQSVDAASALALISEAETLLDQAEQIKTDQPEIAELRTQMAEAADQLGNVQRLYYLPQLRQYPDSGTNLKDVIIQGVEVYVLDRGNNRIFHHRLDDLGETLQPDDESLLLAAQGQVVDETTMGLLIGMTWMPAGGNRQTSDLVILSSSGLFEFNPNWGLTTSTITGGEALVFPVAISSFFGNFYILDPQANKLLRYLPTADGYSAPPESYFPADQPVDLTNAVDFTIDGAIYVLFNDGHIGKYLSGQPVEDFNVSGLNQPFNNPVSIFTAPNETIQHLYVADAGNQRIVQLEKNGTFMRQFKPRIGEAVSFANLQDIYVDEISARMYILDSNNLYVANIPTAEQP